MLPGQPKHTQSVYENCSSSLCVLLARLSRSNMCSQVSKGKDGEAEAPVKKKVVYSRKKGPRKGPQPSVSDAMSEAPSSALDEAQDQVGRPQALCRQVINSGALQLLVHESVCLIKMLGLLLAYVL